MQIEINEARENNLKNISLHIPHNKITAITGVSGSGKSTLLKNILASYGANNLVRTFSQAVRNELSLSNIVKVKSVLNLPQTVLINPRTFVSNSTSTVSTLSGIHEIIRNLFIKYGEVICPQCGKRFSGFFLYNGMFAIDVIRDKNYNDVLLYISKYGSIKKELFFDKNGNDAKNPRKAAKATILFYLNNPTFQRISDINNQIRSEIYCDLKNKFNPLDFFLCPQCNNLLPQLSRKRFSVVTSYEQGGSVCNSCNGTGYIADIDPSVLVVNKDKTIINGGIKFVSKEGIQYTNINFSKLKAITKFYGININEKIKNISDKNLLSLLRNRSIITMNKGKGVKETIEFKGIAGTLKSAFLTGKGEKKLADICNKKICNSCNALGFDHRLNCLFLFGKSISDLLSMTIVDFMNWCMEIKIKAPNDVMTFLDKIISKTQIFSQLSCGHLELFRKAKKLSGGEVQRLRIGALLNSNIRGVCYLLDEPSTGLHFQDIDTLGNLLKKICSDGNTIVMVDHNKEMLRFCDHIIDMGPNGGDKGGEIIFDGNIDSFLRSKSITAKAILEDNIYVKKIPSIRSKSTFFSFNNLNENNLKNLNIKIPRNSFSVICGISGSGKSTLLNNVIFNRMSKSISSFNCNDIVHIGQRSIASGRSYVASILNISNYIAKIYAKESNIPLSCFLLNSRDNKCLKCKGKGILLSKEREFLGVCDACGGKRFSDKILSIKINNLNIYDVLSMPISILNDNFHDRKINEISSTCQQLGLGYISLLRESETLSKGELQRVHLANILTQATTNNVILMDEPSIGLHANDIKNLLKSINKLTLNNNTVITVEHNPTMISAADYIIELGGCGKNGGKLLYSGTIDNIKNTPTANAIKNPFLLSKKQCTQASQEIEINVSGELKHYKYNGCYNVYSEKENFISLCNNVKNNFLSNLIPGNVLFSDISKNSDAKWLKTPFLFNVDFLRKIKQNFSIYDVLGIKKEIIALIMQEYPNESDLLRYVFDDSSLTGKCPACKGRGLLHIVPIEFFIEKNSLSKAAKSFLAKSTIFSNFNKYLKQTRSIDLLKDFSKLDEHEKNLFLWGIDKTITIEEEYRWAGFFTYFLHNHLFYPNQNIAIKALSQKDFTTCPICNANMLEQKYLGYKILGFNYHDILSMDIEFLLNKFKSYKKQNFYTKRIIETFELLLLFELSGIRLMQSISELDEKSSGIIHMISLFMNRIYFTGILLSNTSILSSSQLKILNKIVNKWKESNTIFLA